MSSSENHRSASVSRTGVMVVAGLVLALVALLIPALTRAREAARRTHSRNMLKQIGLALHNYDDIYRVLPPGGVFDADGVAYHEWTTVIAPFLDASHWYSGIAFEIPWDDPKQVDLFHTDLHGQKHCWINPSLPDPVRPDGLISNHYAGNETVFFRNSSVSLKQLGGQAERLLVGDAYDQFLPVGAPFGWRDITLGLASDPQGFGCSVREITQCTMGDGSVRELSNDADEQILQAMAGPADGRPTKEQVRRISEYPLLDLTRIWTIEERWTEVRGYRETEYLRTPPDGRTPARAR